MKPSAILILVILIVSVISPFTAKVPAPSDNQKEYFFVSLDVCHTSGTFICASADVPSMYECICDYWPFGSAEFLGNNNLHSVLSEFNSQLDQPPRIS